MVAALAAVSLSAGTAHADDSAQKRLSKFGKLAPAAATRVANAVSARMKRAADMTNSGDPLRMAASQALFGSPTPADTLGAAKVRLRLYAGLNDWALDNMFSPKPGAVASCINAFQLQPAECGALIAAGGKTSVADATKRGGGAAPNAAAGGGQGSGQTYGFARQPQAGGGYGYQQRPQQYGGYGQQPQGYGQPQGGYRPMQGYGQPQQQQAYGGYRQPQGQAQGQYGYRPAAQPGYGARPAPAAAAPAAPPPPNPQQVASRKAEYERKRQEYLDRKRAEMEARKSKVVQTAGGTDRVQRGPGSETEAEVAGLDKSAVAQPAPSASKAGAAKSAPTPDEGFAEAPAEEKGGAPALDNDLLGDLLGDPLNKKK